VLTHLHRVDNQTPGCHAYGSVFVLFHDPALHNDPVLAPAASVVGPGLIIIFGTNGPAVTVSGFFFSVGGRLIHSCSSSQGCFLVR